MRLALRIWRAYVRVKRSLKRLPIADLTADLAGPSAAAAPLRPDMLSRAVDRSLRIGRIRPRCLTSSLVLFRLLRAQGDPAELVIGLPPDAKDHAAHAWIEIDGIDVGPPPGRGRHAELARFPQGANTAAT